MSGKPANVFNIFFLKIAFYIVYNPHEDSTVL